jgi:ribosomal protein L12E/L44/L45/RPP1/RPP2
MELLLSQLSGKDITELIAAGREKFASVPCGSGGVAVAASAPVGGAGGASAAEKKEEKVEEKEESDDVRTLSWHMSLLATFPALSFGKLFLTFVCIF